ncbi:MAG: hypothetical protein H7Y60_12880 [Rhodospirillaceae bacterium]|nr:hypothetical protein [Rhodospirillales bacterium]
MMTPIHTASINGHPVRLFRSPLNDGRPDFNWVAWDDLLAAFPLPSDMKTDFIRRLRSDWPDESRTVATAEGLAVLVAHHAAQGFLAAMTECLGIDAECNYAMGAAAALKLMTGHLAFPDGVVAYAAAASRRWDAEGGTA